MEGSHSQEDACLVASNIILRDYQQTLVEVAKRQNSILFLPAGCGKTLIAINVLCSRAAEMEGDFPGTGKRAFFVAPTKVLVFQIYKGLSIHTNFKVGHYVGDMGMDFWSEANWQRELKKFQVIVLTGDIFRQILQLQCIAPSDITLIVFDECHHATAQHPFRLILQRMNKEPLDKSPLILGLTAVLLNSNPKKKNVRSIVADLEKSFRGVILTSHTNEAARFAARPKETLVEFVESDALVAQYLPFYDEAIEFLRKTNLVDQEETGVPASSKPFRNTNRARIYKKWIANAKATLQECGLYCGALSILYHILLVEKSRLMSTNPLEINVLVHCRKALERLREILLGAVGKESLTNIYLQSSHKVQYLLTLLRIGNQNCGGKQRSTIVFVRRRETAIVIATLLKKLKQMDPDFGFVKPEFTVGTNVFDKDACQRDLSNEAVVREFALGNLNTLVSTNLLEEGIDVRVCNAVISFDFPMSYSSYFQSRGRAREKGGLYYLFVDQREARQKKMLLEEYKQIEAELYDIICSRQRKLGQLDEEAFLDAGEEEDEEKEDSWAVRAVYRYCSKQPADRYSWPFPTAWYTEVPGGKKASVQFPGNCPVQDVIEGEVMPSRRLARKSAFVAALTKLKEMGEVDENWNPVSCGPQALAYDHFFPHYKEERGEEKGTAGTRKRRRSYEVKFAHSLSECLPQPREKAYLHVLDFAFDFGEDDGGESAKLQEVLRRPVTFGILTSKKLFEICQFPMFKASWRIHCKLLVNQEEVVLSESELEDVKFCHLALFEKVLDITKPYQIFDNRNKGHSFFVVPLCNKSEAGRFGLNWEVIRCDFCKGNVSRQGLWGFPTRAAACENFVISPKYRDSKGGIRYVVYETCHDMTPSSPFPDSGYADFRAYYKAKYRVEITDLTQPLLKVAAVFAADNFKKPNPVEKHRDRTTETYEQLFVPELCDIVPFEKRYWVKAQFLPTALNRLCQLYFVEEFRRKMVNELGFGAAELPDDAEWKPLEGERYLGKDEGEKGATGVSTHLPMPVFESEEKVKPGTESVDFGRNLVDIDVSDMGFMLNFFGDVNMTNEVMERLRKVQEGGETTEATEAEDSPKVPVPVPWLEIFNRRELDAGPDLTLLVQALTSRSAKDCVNYERLEILGDAFLKFATSTFLFKNVNGNEGVLTTLKGKLVGNANLLYCGLAKGFQYVLNVSEFVPSSGWNPPLLRLPEKLAETILSSKADPQEVWVFEISPEERFSGNVSDETVSKNEAILMERWRKEGCGVAAPGQISAYECLFPYRQIADKGISDAVEAVAGVYLREFGLFGGLEMLIWLGILPREAGSHKELLDKASEPDLAPRCDATSVENVLKEVFPQKLERALGYTFRNKGFLLEAVTHPTYRRNRVTHCYQRLEFLGDAVLDFLITCYIYQYCGEMTPGQVTDLRSALTNNITFASLAVDHGLQKYLLKQCARLSNAIEDFVSRRIVRDCAVDENDLLVLEEEDNVSPESVQVPKALGDVFESLAGAIFLDSGNSLETVWTVYYRLMKREIDAFEKSIPINPVRLLYERCKKAPVLEKQDLGVIKKVTYTVCHVNAEIKVDGFGRNTGQAKRMAAKRALKKMAELEIRNRSLGGG